VSRGEDRNAELSRAAILAAAGAALTGLQQQAMVGAPALATTVVLIAGGLAVAVGLGLAVRALMGRGKDNNTP
jgi:hypothetical protein